MSTEARALTRAETCTTVDCAAPRIRLNALKCTEHEVVYRAAAKARAADRRAALVAAIAADARAAKAAARADARAAKLAAKAATA